MSTLRPVEADEEAEFSKVPYKTTSTSQSGHMDSVSWNGLPTIGYGSLSRVEIVRHLSILYSTQALYRDLTN